MNPATKNIGVFDGLAVPQRRYVAEGAYRPRYFATLGLLALFLSIAVIIGMVWDAAVTDESIYACPPDCGHPPNSVPVESLPRFVAPGGAFSVAYPRPGANYAVTTAANGVTARMTTGDGGVLRLFSEPAQNRDARRVVEQILATQYPTAGIAYELPNAAVGYQPGYGVVANFQPPGLSSRTDERLILIAAEKNGLALVASAEGPFRRFSPDFGPGPPSAANAEIALDMGKYVDSFLWRDDPGRVAGAEKLLTGANVARQRGRSRTRGDRRGERADVGLLGRRDGGRTGRRLGLSRLLLGAGGQHAGTDDGGRPGHESDLTSHT